MTFVENFPEGFFFIRCKEAPMAVDVHGGGMTVKKAYYSGQRCILI